MLTASGSGSCSHGPSSPASSRGHSSAVHGSVSACASTGSAGAHGVGSRSDTHGVCAEGSTVSATIVGLGHRGCVVDVRLGSRVVGLGGRPVVGALPERHRSAGFGTGRLGRLPTIRLPGRLGLRSAGRDCGRAEVPAVGALAHRDIDRWGVGGETERDRRGERAGGAVDELHRALGRGTDVGGRERRGGERAVVERAGRRGQEVGDRGGRVAERQRLGQPGQLREHVDVVAGRGVEGGVEERGRSHRQGLDRLLVRGRGQRRRRRLGERGLGEGCRGGDRVRHGRRRGCHRLRLGDGRGCGGDGLRPPASTRGRHDHRPEPLGLVGGDAEHLLQLLLHAGGGPAERDRDGVELAVLHRDALARRERLELVQRAEVRRDARILVVAAELGDGVTDAGRGCGGEHQLLRRRTGHELRDVDAARSREHPQVALGDRAPCRARTPPARAGSDRRRVPLPTARDPSCGARSAGASPAPSA